MTPSVYVIGGAGTGKSTFMAALTAGLEYGELEGLHTRPMKNRGPVTLRGHRLSDGGIYVGYRRAEFPGTDGLDKVSSPSATEWVEIGGPDRFSYVVAEGATLATRNFISALHNHTALLLVHLVVDDFIKELRFHQRGSDQAWSFVDGTATRAAGLLDFMSDRGVSSLELDTSGRDQWDAALSICRDHLRLAT